jgi:hypothetical protein
MVLTSYYKFIINPNMKNFNDFIKNINEFKEFYKLDKKKMDMIIKNILENHLESNKLKIKTNQQIPLFNASCFPLHFKLPTLNKLWITVKSKNNIVWRLLTDYDFKQIYNKHNGIQSFKFNKKTIESHFELIKVANKLNTFGNVLAIGELTVHYEKILPNYYSVYEIGGTLIAVPYMTPKTKILKALWQYTGNSISVDAGTFGFHNGTIFNYLKLTKSKNKKFGENINSNYTDLIKPDKTEIYGKNLIKFKNEKLNEWIINNSLEKELLGFYCENNYGDGIFDIYKSANMYLILSADVQQLMNQLDNEYFNEIF